MKNVLVLAAHPDLRLSRVNRALLDAACARAQASDGWLEVSDLYALYPDYAIDVPAEQAKLVRADLVVWLHPIHWYGMPPLMKLWLDDVLAHGWAYGKQGRALFGKDVWLVCTTGGHEDAYSPTGYNRYHFDAFLPPYEQTAALCGMRFVPPMVLHGAHDVPADVLAAHVQTFVERLGSYPDWPELADMAECELRDIPEQDRPVEVAAEAAAESPDR